jgi:hypothetical protein
MVSPPRVSRRTLRILFEYEGDEFRILNKVRVDKITPPTLTPCPEPGKSAGYWVELRDARGNCLFHRLLPDAIRDSAEIYPEGKSLTRTPLREVKSQFEVLLPDLPESDTVLVMGHPLSSQALKIHQKTGVLARFKLNEEQTEEKR